MKDFVKWLGDNEKVAKLVVWILIIFVMLILTNAMLDSIGFPHYKITYNNLKEVHISKVFQYIINWLILLLNFYAITLLIFKIRDFKKITKYAIIYLICNVLLSIFTNFAIVQIFIWVYVIAFSYFYSGRKPKYILYAIISVLINIGIQAITYYYKAKLIDYSSVTQLTKMFLFSDYIIIMGIIILVKEVYLKKRSERICGEDKAGFGSVNSKKKENSQKN